MAVLLVFLLFPGAVTAQDDGAASSDATQKEKNAQNQNRNKSTLTPSGEMIQPSWSDEPLKNVIEDLSVLGDTNIRLSDSVDPSTKINYVSPIPLYWRDVMTRVLEQYNLLARRIGSRQLEIVKPKRVNMQIRNSQLTSIIDTLAKLAGISIIVSPQVASQNVTIPQMNLNDVPWQAALETVVKTAGFATVQEDYGIRRVITKTELRDQLETKTFQLRYLRPTGDLEGDITSKFLDDQDDEEDLLTEGRFEWGLLNVIDGFLTKPGGEDEPIGELQYERKQNIIVVKDTPQVLQKIEGMLEVLDREPPQVLIQVRFISTTNQFLRDLGMELNTTGTSLTGAQFGTAIASSSAEGPTEGRPGHGRGSVSHGLHAGFHPAPVPAGHLLPGRPVPAYDGGGRSQGDGFRGGGNPLRHGLNRSRHRRHDRDPEH